MESPVAIVLLNELQSLDVELRVATGQRPKLDAYLSDLDGKAQEITGAIKERETELSAAIAANEVLAQMGTRNSAAARVVGRISMFLEDLAPNEELARLEGENRRLKLRVEDLEERIGTDDSNLPRAGPPSTAQSPARRRSSVLASRDCIDLSVVSHQIGCGQPRLRQ